ncbi:MAG: tRNA pseudouridine(38-40) synthase TruA [Mariprofundaceae bacterium]
MVLQRIAMAVEFDGKAFHGWQRQKNAISVQSVLERALEKVEGYPVVSVAAGRTDAGVHAKALLVHADVNKERWQRSMRAYTQGVNQQLPDSVRVTGVRAVKNDFHARFDCRERRYRYQIWNRSTPSAIHQWRHWWMPRNLDLNMMKEASHCLLGTHDFSSFRASGCQASTAVREVRRIDITQQDLEIHIDIDADAFLYHMVRNIVGSLVQVGTGSWPAEKLLEVLSARDRNKAAATAPAHGLYFTDAIYQDFSATELIGKEGL